jgi:hypothetical protein
MPGPISTVMLTGRRIFNALFPNQGPRELSVSVDFSFAATQQLNIDQASENGEIDFIQTVWADNSASGATLFITNNVNGQTIQYPAGSIGYQPVMGDRNPKYTVSCTDNTQTAIQIKFINVPISSLMTYASSRSSFALGNNVDGVAPVTTGLQGDISYIYGYDRVGNNFNRVSLNPNGANNSITNAGTVDSLIVTAMLYASNTGGILEPLNAVNGADGLTTGNQLPVMAMNMLFNGASYDRQRSNIDTAALQTLVAQAAGTVTSADQTNYNGRGVKLGINTTATTGTITVSIQGKDAASGVYYTIATGTAIAAPGFTTLTVYPGITTAANADVSDILPRTWRTSVTVGAGGGASATVGASVIL